MKKRKAVWIILCLLLCFLNACEVENEHPYQYESMEEIKALFSDHVTLFTEVSEILLNHEDFFYDLYETTGRWRITTPDIENDNEYFSNEEWEKVRELFNQVPPKQVRYFTSLSPAGAPKSSCKAPFIEFLYIIDDKINESYGYSFCYIKPIGNGSKAEKERVVDCQLAYLHGSGTTNELGEEYWYEWIDKDAPL